jgi:hypothetical protein
MGWAGVFSVKSVNDMQTLLEWLKGFDGFRKFSIGQGATVFHPIRDTSTRLKTLILEKENDPLHRRRLAAGTKHLMRH